MMDAAALATLLSDSTQKLIGLHAQIGHPPEALQGALDALHQALKTAVDDQIGKVQREAQDLSAECARIETDNAHIKRALLGDKSSSPSLQNAIGQRMVSAARRLHPLQLQHRQILGPSCSAITTTNRTDTLESLLHCQRGALGSTLIQASDLRCSPRQLRPYSSRQRAVVSIQPRCRFTDHLARVSQPRMALFEAEIIRCSKEVHARSERLQTNLLEIVQLWSELYLEPARQQHSPMTAFSKPSRWVTKSTAVEARSALIAPSSLTYSGTHLRRRDIASSSASLSAPSSQSAETPAANTQAIDDLLSETPTRASLGGQPARVSGDLALQLSAGKAASTSASPSHLLEPSELHLARAARSFGG